ncbi:hypothetical protein [Aeropyrum camini]|uniref:Uncharacterized protein n=1 Tax=Aeropyrum camini SY1 = JCM 12091 TaxID=1198449 RepID=U3TG37_9CREN|nr:hypothetical protein [Aeropyrum camini]BAN90279.1 hypothetical protein ACAM_0810 [Aeropyrum camini SY1 = JCM 12091]
MEPETLNLFNLAITAFSLVVSIVGSPAGLLAPGSRGPLGFLLLSIFFLISAVRSAVYGYAIYSGAFGGGSAVELLRSVAMIMLATAILGILLSSAGVWLVASASGSRAARAACVAGAVAQTMGLLLSLAPHYLAPGGEGRLLPVFGAFSSIARAIGLTLYTVSILTAALSPATPQAGAAAGERTGSGASGG